MTAWTTSDGMKRRHLANIAELAADHYITGDTDTRNAWYRERKYARDYGATDREIATIERKARERVDHADRMAARGIYS